MNSPDLELGMISLDNKTEYSLVCPGCGLGKTIVEVYNNYEQNHYPGVLDGVLFHLKQKGSKGKLRLPDFLKEEVNENHALFNPELNQPHYKGGVLYLVGNVEDIMGAVDSMLIPLDIN